MIDKQKIVSHLKKQGENLFSLIREKCRLNMSKMSNLPLTCTWKVWVSFPTLLLAEQVYCPPSEEVAELRMKSALQEEGRWCEGRLHWYVGAGFPLALQLRFRGSPTEMEITPLGKVSTFGLSVYSVRQGGTACLQSTTHTTGHISGSLLCLSQSQFGYFIPHT